MTSHTPTPRSWKPTASLATLQRRAVMLRAARHWMHERNILEVDTAHIVATAVTDINIESIPLKLAISGANHYLHTSPEYAMKRLLAAGAPDIYQLGHVFRDGEAGRAHQPEFTLLEWYRLNYGLQDIIGDTVSLIQELIGDKLQSGDVQQLSYRQAFEQALGIDPIAAPLAALLNVAVNAPDSIEDDRDSLLDFLLVSEVIPAFSKKTLTVLTHYPATQAALAELAPDDPRTAQRFEIFLADSELANGFVELRNADEQVARFQRDLEIRAQRQQVIPGMDRQFIDALQSGLPACAGVAVGFDRLVMIASGNDDIRDVIPFVVVD